ncbi:glycoside hydrolase family 31 protein [Conidiobolus coronatus NRRL 28638]|uniref:Glucosidase II subunit alpha n=1 Tax=Conidiobolus coronatus (strain ATCC 28846 / CBS 209.66 / NRRL 28638) TaxID=796925 RepID=A0A137PFM4_CONC2|nr:glycoside hydrolase family 31 protein [Conidiobolus coronatus NRRL 28638]|eukprot:KXN73806.1 glycoside hydrolase family 31 protein [Conidiobolus coronatus NRRL 28638]
MEALAALKKVEPQFSKNTFQSVSFTRKLILFLFILTFSISIAEAVKKEDFKRCDDSGFCKRNRALAKSVRENKTKSPYSILKDTVKWRNEGVFEAQIQNKNNDILFKLELSPLEGDAFRVLVDEQNPIKPRFQDLERHVFASQPKIQNSENLKTKSEGSSGYSISYSPDLKLQAKISYDPFKIQFYKGNTLVLSLNDQNLFNFEHYRNKPEAKDEPSSTEGSNTDSDLEAGQWEETFNGHRDLKPNGPSSIGLDVSFHGIDHVYGLPEHTSTLSLKSTDGSEGNYDQPYRLYNLDVFEYDLDSPMALYGAIPFALGHNPNVAAGVFWMNSAEMWIDVQKPKNQIQSHWISESGIVDLFVFLGDKPKDIVKQYTRLTGTIALPPSFSISYHQCRWNYLDQDDVLTVNKKFDEYDIPYDVLWLDIEHTDGKKYFTWDFTKFPDPKAMQNTLGEHGRKMVTIVDPHIKRDDEYKTYKEATEKGYFVQNENKSDFDGWCWPGSSSWLDYTRDEVCEWWSEQFQFDKYDTSTKYLYTWNDMNEPSVFNGPEITMHKHLLHNNGTLEHREIHNLYGSLMHRSTAVGLVKRQTPNRRPFVLSRAFFPGTQRYSAIWTGDNAATWGYLQSSVPMLLSLGLGGIGFSGADVGGFFGDPSSDLMVRWYQAGAFQPFFRAHAHIDTKRREPWLLQEDHVPIVRDAVRTRYALLPFWYTLFFEATINGVPPMRPLFLEFPEDKTTYDIEDHHMVGSSLLVKPIVHPDVESTEVYLPGKETWYNYFTHQSFKPGKKHTVPVKLQDIPVFVKGGSVIPQRNRIRRSSDLMLLDPITLFITLDNKGKASGELYLDDGDSYNYLNQDYVHRVFKVENNEIHNIKADPVTPPNPLQFQPSTEANDFVKKLNKIFVERVVILGISKEPKSVTIDGKELKSTYESSTKKLIIKTVLTDESASNLISTEWKIKWQ